MRGVNVTNHLVWMLAPLVTGAVALSNCGGKAVIDSSGGGGTGGSTILTTSSGDAGAPPASCEDAPCGAPCLVDPASPQAPGQCTDDGICLFEAICPDPCLRLPACDPCVVCINLECSEGTCDPNQVCDPNLTCEGP